MLKCCKCSSVKGLWYEQCCNSSLALRTVTAGPIDGVSEDDVYRGVLQKKKMNLSKHSESK